MKRIQLEPWTPYDKLSLASAVLRTGDQNWNAVARATRNIFEESTKYMIEEKRSPEWFSNKQCAAQYEALLKNIGPRRKKKAEKSGTEHIGDSPNDIILHAVRQECIEELKRSLASTQALYLKLHKEYEDIQAGKMDHKLEEMLEEYEAKEREKEIKMKLKFKLGEKNPEIMENSVNVNIKTEDSEIKKSVDKEPPVSEPAKTNLTTSPLLTSLLQSPSPLTRPSLPPNTSPTISLLLNSSPSVPSSESPTLTKLLEASSSVVGSPLAPVNVSATPQVNIKQDSSLSSATNSTTIPVAITATSSSTPVTAQTTEVTSSPPTTVTSPSISVSVPSSAVEISTSQAPSIKAVDQYPVPAITNVTAAIAPIVSTMVETRSPEAAPTSSNSNVVVHTIEEKPPSPLVTSDADYEQVSEDVVLKSENSSEDKNVGGEKKETLEIEEVTNPTTPEIVLEDLVHSVVESEVVIDQETPTSKRKDGVRRVDLEQVEETETDDEVMETVEQIIEKVEEAIIETVGEETTEIDLALNQSSETDNLSDNIETLELDSDAVELIVLGHNQGKVITIRHDTEIGSDPVKSDPSVDEVPPHLDSFGEIENIVEEEVSTCEEKNHDEEEAVEEEEEEEEDIKLQEEIVEHEEIVEDKETEEISEASEENEVASNIELVEEKVVEEKDEVLVKELESKKEEGEEEKSEEAEVEEVKDEDNSQKEEEVAIKTEESIIERPDDSIKESSIVCNDDDIKKNEKNSDGVMEVTKTEIIVDELKGVKNVSIVKAKAEEAVVEEAPEEVVIAELVEEVVQAEKLQNDKLINLEPNKEETAASLDTDVAGKQKIVEDASTEVLHSGRNDVKKVSTLEEGSLGGKKEDDVLTTKKEEKILEPIPKEEEQVLPSSSGQDRRIQQDKALDSKEMTRTPAKSEENSSSALNPEFKNVKTAEKNIEHPKNVESKPNQEVDKRRTGRKRYQLTGCADSKPNSPAPSSHSMEDDREYKAWKKSIMLVYNRLAAHKYASVFLKPITEAEATGYHNVVLRPMDLTTIKRNIETGVIRSTVEFQRDMILMAQNAMIYNKADSLVFKMAEDMLADMMSQMEVMVQALGDGVPLWGDSDEKLHTRGRASKLQLDESSSQKRRSQTDDTPSRRRQQTDDSAKKRKGQNQEDVAYKRKSEDNKKKSLSEDSSKKKTVEESLSKKKNQLEDSSIKKKGQFDESFGKKKGHSDDSSNSARKKTLPEETSSTKKKLQSDEGGIKKTSDDVPSSGKRKSLQIEDQNKRKNETPVSKRKSQFDETPSSKRKSAHAEDTPISKRKSQVDETPTNKRKRSSAVASEEPRSGNKRKRADAI